MILLYRYIASVVVIGFFYIPYVSFSAEMAEMMDYDSLIGMTSDDDLEEIYNRAENERFHLIEVLSRSVARLKEKQERLAFYEKEEKQRVWHLFRDGVGKAKSKYEDLKKKQAADWKVFLDWQDHYRDRDQRERFMEKYNYHHPLWHRQESEMQELSRMASTTLEAYDEEKSRIIFVTKYQKEAEILCSQVESMQARVTTLNSNITQINERYKSII